MALPSARYREIYDKHAAARLLDPRLIEAVVMTESSGDPLAKRDEWRKDRMGKPYLWDTSRGLMQVLASTAVGLGWPSTEAEDRMFDPDVAVLYGTKLLTQNLDVFNKTQKPRANGAYAILGTPFPNEVRVALARYNGGGKGNPGDDGSLRNESYVQKVEAWFVKVAADRSESGGLAGTPSPSNANA